MTVRADLTIPIGDTWWSPLYAVIRGGQALDLEDGWTVRAQARARPYEPTVFYAWDAADDHILIGTATVSTTAGGIGFQTSTVQLFHPGTVSEQWPVWDGVFDIEIRKDDDVFTLVTGTIRTLADVTR